jgi:peptidoglycan/LPS O-acetylase OafA/YrhL
MADRPAPAQIDALTGLRGLAALWVVLFHLTLRQHWSVLDAGWLGVDMFFTLSGFVLTYVYADRAIFGTLRGYIGFLMTRLARIYPLHVFALLLMGLVVVSLPGAFPASFTGSQVRILRGLAEALLLVQNWPFMSLNNWNEPAWTLSTEWLAYVLFPGFLWAANLPRTGVSALGIAVMLPLLYAIGLAYYGSPVENYIDDLANFRMIAGFGAGCLACQASRRITALPAALTPVAFALIALAVQWPAWRVMAMVGFVLLVLVAARDQGRLGRFLSSRPLVFLGDISFSVYLLHLILLNTLSYLLGIDATLSVGLRIMWIIGFVGLTVALATLSYRFIEQPTRGIGRSWAKRVSSS